MNIKSTNKLSALICGLILLPLTLLAQNQIVTSSTTEESKPYHDVSGYSALDVRGDGVVYNGTNITLTATFNTNYSSITLANGAYVTDRATLSLTDSAISTTGSWGHGVILTGSSTGTLNNVNIETKEMDCYGVFATNFSTLTLTGGTITTDKSRANGINLTDSSSGTVSNVNIETKGSNAYGVFAGFSSTLTLTGGTITTGNDGGYGIHLYGTSSGTVNDASVKTTASYADGVLVYSSSTLTLTNSDISATGDDSNAIHIYYNSTGTVSLNHNTLTGNITAELSSTLTLTGSNGTVITGDVTAFIGFDNESDGSTINLTLNGSETKLIGTATHDAYSAINLTIENGTQLNQLTGNINTLTLQNGATLSSDDSNGALLLNGASITVTTDLLTLSDGTILDFNSGDMLTLTGNLAIGNGILVNFGGQAMGEGDTLLILNWSGANLIGEVTVDSFTATDLAQGMTGTFTLSEAGLTFTAHTIPEPTTCILLGAGLGILLLTARRNAQS